MSIKVWRVWIACDWLNAKLRGILPRWGVMKNAFGSRSLSVRVVAASFRIGYRAPNDPNDPMLWFPSDPNEAQRVTDLARAGKLPDIE